MFECLLIQYGLILYFIQYGLQEDFLKILRVQFASEK